MVRKPKHRFWRGKVLPKLALTVAPLPRNTFCSIDVTNRCNLRCKHCYFYSYDQERGPELTVDDWIARIEGMQKGRRAFFSCTWVGGEALLRPELVDRGRKFFRANRVVTNGTLPLPDWKNVEFHVSIDGTEELHDSLRGKGCYAKIKKNLASESCPDINVAIACCLSRSNVGCIEDLIEEWKRAKAPST
jgi:sulfatase maturation enzyme AslB (radical SAM superfamily)